jgi:citrate synthase
MTKGLAGIVAGETKISATTGGRLTFAGYTIEQLNAMDLSFEAIVYLLWHLRLPSESELNRFCQILSEQMFLPEHYVHILTEMIRPGEQHPMSLLRSGMSLLGTLMNDQAQHPIAIMAKVPLVIGTIIRLQNGLEPLQAKPELSYPANLYYLSTGKVPDAETEEVFTQTLILHVDHEFNASTFTARVIASTNSDYFSSLTGAIGALKGPLHGGANERVYQMLQTIVENQLDPEKFVANELAEGRKVMGFGHRVYKDGDPREKILKKYAKSLAIKTHQEVWFDTAETVEKYMWAEKHIIPNVDFYSATIYHCMGFAGRDFTLLFAASRSAGWLAHIAEQYSQHTLIRPNSKYVGPYHADIAGDVVNSQNKAQ